MNKGMNRGISNKKYVVLPIVLLMIAVGMAGCSGKEEKTFTDTLDEIDAIIPLNWSITYSDNTHPETYNGSDDCDYLILFNIEKVSVLSKSVPSIHLWLAPLDWEYELNKGYITSEWTPSVNDTFMGKRYLVFYIDESNIEGLLNEVLSEL